jgi:hypothetical protein
MSRYGHPRLNGALLNVKYSLAEAPFEQRLNALLAGPGSAASAEERNNIGRVAPEPRNVLIGTAARAARNAAATAPSPPPANEPAAPRPRPRRRPPAAAPSPTPNIDPSDVLQTAPSQLENIDPSDVIRDRPASRENSSSSDVGRARKGGFWGPVQRMLQSARSAAAGAEAAGAASAGVGSDPQTSFREMIGGQNPKLKYFMWQKKRDLMRGGPDPETIAYLSNKKKDLRESEVENRLDTNETGTPPVSLAALLSSPDGQIRLPEELTGSLLRGAGFVSDGARTVRDGTRNIINDSLRNFRNS